MITQYRETYKKTNNSIKRSELIYPLTNRGFFSELNNLALAALYCIDNKIKLRLYSGKWVSGKWEDYFNPIFEEYKGIIPIPHDIFVRKRIESFYMIYHKHYKKRKILQDDIWSDMRRKSFINKHFFYPELGINGDIFEAKKQIFDIILDYNHDTTKEIFSLNETDLKFVKESCGIHVRRGDKVKGNNNEAESFDIEFYINKSQEFKPEIKKFTICTDDNEVLESFKKKFPEFNYLSFCPSTRFGYFQKEYNNAKKHEKRTEVINILKDAYLLSSSEMFVGTYSSNISRFVTLIRNNKDCHSLDIPWTPL
ncbi:hypothetical protein [Flavobacterium urumqiense]|uniref:Alpha-(1,6)-fucosyltransferase N- and catalytic domain-containing protein n=1 Tax=Flavobacterium urumqiense TaxID=935224 RepID=A0A1H6ATH2_9FLAO|nr:hypothetical protein [Flavobacterium urumqiense]SEG51325.1 hypothetical protein SAMN04488130_11933 [Flavobacterium urumqiense]